MIYEILLPNFLLVFRRNGVLDEEELWLHLGRNPFLERRQATENCSYPGGRLLSRSHSVCE